MRRTYLPPLLIIVAVLASYGGFFYSPVTFDDIKFFSDTAINQFLTNFKPWLPRQLAYGTLALSWEWFGPRILPLRLASLFLHAAVGVALYFFLQRVAGLLVNRAKVETRWLSLLAALIFALHPVAVYGAAYLIQRTILLATLCALLSWMCVLRGLDERRAAWLWCSVLCYAGSVLSKEHAVMVPAVGLLLALWWRQSSASDTSLVDLLRQHRHVAAAYLLVGVLVVLYARGFLGHAYEFEVQSIASNDIPVNAWPLSVMTQAFLFFKYLWLWLCPNVSWMSADMREPFATSLAQPFYVVSLLAFLGWAVVGAVLLWRGGRIGLVGVAMLAPWLLFATELMTVRYLEIFVLYRSYLWLAPAFVMFAVLQGKLPQRLVYVLLVLVPIVLFPLTWSRLMTFSHPFLLWDDALRLAKGKQGVYGVHRIYVDRGVELHRLGRYDMAIQDYTSAIEIKPNFSPAYGGRASALAESGRLQKSMADFDKAIELQPGNAIYWANRAKALESMGRIEESSRSFQEACDIGWLLWCDKATQLKQQADSAAPATPAPAS